MGSTRHTTLKTSAPTGVAMRASAISVLLCVSMPASAFDIDGYSSGMSIQQLINLARNRGQEVWQISGNETGPGQGWVVGRRKEKEIGASVFFCHDSLQTYTHNIDFDAEYWQLLRSLLSEHGQPQKVEAQQQVWPGPGGGYITSTSLSWRVGVDEISLKFNPGVATAEETCGISGRRR